MLGPFWRMDSPRTENGGSIVRSPTPGPALFVNAWVEDAGAAGGRRRVDIWQSSPEGLYENQDPSQADMNLRGKFTTDDKGRFCFRSVKPAGYPIPIDGPVGELLRAQGRHNMRPAHLHFLIYKPGYKTLISQVYRDRRSEPRNRRAVRRHRGADRQYVRHENDTPPAPGVKGPGIRSITPSRWRRARRSCRARRSQARPRRCGRSIWRRSIARPRWRSELTAIVSL